VSIHFSQIHNLVRTYQHVLNLDSKTPPAKTPVDASQEDRVTLSSEARELQQQTNTPPSPPNPTAPDDMV